MRVLAWLCVTIATAATISKTSNTTLPILSNFTDAQIDSGSALDKINQYAVRRMRSNINGRGNQTCTFSNASIRQEFRNMTKGKRKAFTDAVTCLQSIPPQSLNAYEVSKYPGVKSRYDEYVATHINYTFNVHMTADFFAWHRFFIFQFERDLQTLCGYNGSLPYWNWARDAFDLESSELFNGNAWSMGSNGLAVSNRSWTYLGLQDVYFPPGSGGSCVTKGPFSNHTVNLGPIDSPYNNNVDSSFQHNPRCLVRDLNDWFSTRYNTYRNVTTLLLSSKTIQDFQSIAQGYASPDNRFGVHGGGHWMVGAPSAMADFHSSPNDPLFFLHHATIDRLWLIWQYLDIRSRQNSISGTSTLNNDPPSPEMSLNDTIPFGFVASDQTFGNLMDTFSGPFCYRY